MESREEMKKWIEAEVQEYEIKILNPNGKGMKGLVYDGNGMTCTDGKCNFETIVGQEQDIYIFIIVPQF